MLNFLTECLISIPRRVIKSRNEKCRLAPTTIRLSIKWLLGEDGKLRVFLFSPCKTRKKSGNESGLKSENGG